MMFFAFLAFIFWGGKTLFKMYTNNVMHNAQQNVDRANDRFKSIDLKIFDTQSTVQKANIFFRTEIKF